MARILGGAAWLLSAALVLLNLAIAAWVIAYAIAIMVGLDAAANLCVLCFVVVKVRR